MPRWWRCPRRPPGRWVAPDTTWWSPWTPTKPWPWRRRWPPGRSMWCAPPARHPWDGTPMGQVVELALAASARDWPDRLHRHVLDHGGARIAGRVLTATQALEGTYDILLIDDVCSFLSPGLVTRLRCSGKQVLGVFDRDDGPDAKRRLLECGVGDVIEADATGDEFLAQSTAMAQASVSAAITPSRPGRTIGVIGVSAGVGATEVAVGLAWSLSRAVEDGLVDLDPGAPSVSQRFIYPMHPKLLTLLYSEVIGVSAVGGPTEVAVGLAWSLSRAVEAVLVDLDPVAPSVAQRLDVPLHPNLLTLIDTVVNGYSHEQVEIALDRLRVVPGLAQPGQQTLPPHEIEMALETLASRNRVVVADLGEASSWGDGPLGWFDSLVWVATGDPVGVTRLVRQAQRWSSLAESVSLVVVVNRSPRRRFHRGELTDEIEGALGHLPLTVVPHDDRVMVGSWDGVPVTRGRFAAAVGRMAGLVASAVTA